MKQLDGSFMVDPLFHRMSQIFDEDGAAGMLLLNRGVFNGSTIMFESGGVPEEQFPLAVGGAAQGGRRTAEGDVAVSAPWVMGDGGEPDVVSDRVGACDKSAVCQTGWCTSGSSQASLRPHLSPKHAPRST